jgi:hypothetical protein
MKRVLLGLMLLSIAAIARSAVPALHDPVRVEASGKADGSIPGWTISTSAPSDGRPIAAPMPRRSASTS